MASIDQFNHHLLGYIYCPSDYDIIFESTVKKIAFYELEQDIPSDETEMDGNKGDILIGGGRGDVPVLRLSMPDCLHYFYNNNIDKIEDFSKIIKSFWTPTQAFKLCNGFIKIGWNPDIDIEFWLSVNICAYLIKKMDRFVEFNSEKITFEKRLFSIPCID